MKNSIDIEKNFLQFTNKWLDEKFFTDCFGACGSLLEDDPYFISHQQKTSNSRIIFDLASITKAVVTTPLVFNHLRKNGLTFTDKLQKWAQIAGTGDMGLPATLLELTAEKLLSHTSGLPPWYNFWIGKLPLTSGDDFDVNEHIKQVLTRAADKVNVRQGEKYSDIGFILLGYALEQCTGGTLNDLFEQLKIHIGLTNNLSQKRWLGFPGDDREIKNHSISCGFCPLRQRELLGEVHDENCAALGGVCAHAGLFGSGLGLIDFLRHFFRHDLGKFVLQENTDRLTQKLPLLGLRKADDESSNVFAGGCGIGHMGFTGTAFWINPDNLDYAVLLTNRVVSGRVSSKTKGMRREGFKILNEICAMHH